MPDFDQLAASVDDVANRAERDTLDTINRRLRPTEERLEREIRGLAREARDSQSKAFRQARAQAARSRVATIMDQLDLDADSDVPRAFMEMQRRSYENGIRTAEGTLQAYNAELPARFAIEVMGPNVDVRKLESLATESVKRLRHHAREIVGVIQEEVTEHLVRGHGIGKTTRALRARTDFLRYEAERIVRTETMSTTDDARKQTFRTSGIEYEQRIAAADARTCPFCLARDGNVYRIGEAPAVIHPNDRCVTVPWQRDWPEEVRGDTEHRARRARTRDSQKIEPNYGPASFEKQQGVEPPSPIWAPE